MKLKITLVASLLLLAGLVLGRVPQQPEDEDVRGAFLTTRPKEKANPPKSTGPRPSRRRPKTAKTTPSPMPAGTTGKSENAQASPSPATDSSGKTTGQRVGLGLTLFMRDTNGLAVRVDPSHEFHKGDQVRVLLETNADGYLYLFNTTDNGPPVMIYPEADLDEAGNYIQSHVPFEIPSSTAADERLRWFSFDQVAGTERLYFVFTKEPLQGVPIEDDLINYCREAKDKCPWRPDAKLWAEIQKQMDAPLKTDKAKQFGNTQTSSEKLATTRGLGLSRQDPEPSLIMMAVVTGNKNLVTALDLVHR